MATDLTTLPADDNFYVDATFNNAVNKLNFRRYKRYPLQLHRADNKLHLMNSARATPDITYETDKDFFAEWTKVRLHPKDAF